MNFTKLFAVIAVVFASFIQVGCGTANPTTAGYMQAVNGMCQPGYNLVANNQCAPNTMGYNNGYNTGYNGTQSCVQGPSYISNTGSCQNGYISQGNQCVCQSSITGTGTVTGNNQGCQQGTFFYLNSCFPQGPCMQGYVFYVDQMCHRIQ